MNGSKNAARRTKSAVRETSGKTVVLPARHQMNVKVRHGLGCNFPVGLNHVQPFRVEGAPNCGSNNQARTRERCCEIRGQRPDVRDVRTRDDQRVAKGGRLSRKKRDGVVVPVDLPHVCVGAGDNLAEWALRFEIHRCSPMF